MEEEKGAEACTHHPISSLTPCHGMSCFKLPLPWSPCQNGAHPRTVNKNKLLLPDSSSCQNSLSERYKRNEGSGHARFPTGSFLLQREELQPPWPGAERDHKGTKAKHPKRNPLDQKKKIAKKRGECTVLYQEAESLWRWRRRARKEQEETPAGYAQLCHSVQIVSFSQTLIKSLAQVHPCNMQS